MLFVQISDLHMSDDFDSDGMQFGWGRKGHSVDLAGRLRNALAILAARHNGSQDYSVVVAGDVSRTGTRAEFAVFRDFLEDSAWPRLGRATVQFCFIPGNHDHWNGEERRRKIPAYNPELFKLKSDGTSDFKKTPWIQRFSEPSTGLVLEVFGIDSNSGLQRKPTNRRARGRISPEEFQGLERLLRTSVDAANGQGERVVRVISCHHAFTRRDSRGMHAAFPLNRASRRRLLVMAAEHDVTAVLTGHTHASRIMKYEKRVFRWSDGRDTCQPGFEIRSPTALQASAKVDLLNGFWAHDIAFDAQSGKCVWKPRLFLLSEDRFREMPKKFSEEYWEITPL